MSENTDNPQKSGLKRNVIDQDLKKIEEDNELKKRIVVLPFIDRKNQFSKELLRNSQLSFMDSLNTRSDMLALDAGALKLDLAKYLKDSMYDLKSLALDAEAAGVSCLLEGRVINIRFKDDPERSANSEADVNQGFEVVVQVRLLSVRTGKELFNTVRTVTLQDERFKIPTHLKNPDFFVNNEEVSELLIKDAFLDFNDKLVDSLKQVQWEGRIAAFNGDRIFLNVGKLSGVQIGDILKVVEDASEIYDTEIGYHLGKVKGKVKGTLEVVDYFGQDGAISVIHSGAGFRENDRIEIYQY